jgi:hypothetical protein
MSAPVGVVSRSCQAMRRRGSTRLWVLGVWLGAVACAPEEESVREIPAVTWSGVHLDYAPQPGAYALCEGTLPYMDRYVGLVAEATPRSGCA